MKYMLLVYVSEADWSALPEEDRNRRMGLGGAFCRALAARGQLEAAAQLHPVATATTIRSKAGKQVLTDGPFAETREQLAGYCLIEASDLDEAIRSARYLQEFTPGAIEVRPVMAIEGVKTLHVTPD